MLTTEEREEIRALIIAKITEYEKEVANLREASQSVEPDVAIGRLSRLDSMINAGTAQMALKDAQNKLNRLRNRLQKVDEPTFDQCGLCGGLLTMDRFRAAPDRGICAPCLQKL